VSAASCRAAITTHDSPAVGQAHACSAAFVSIGVHSWLRNEKWEKMRQIPKTKKLTHCTRATYNAALAVCLILEGRDVADGRAAFVSIRGCSVLNST
jgi:hypothetical protein